MLALLPAVCVSTLLELNVFDEIRSQFVSIKCTVLRHDDTAR